MFPAFTEVSRVELTLYTDALITHGYVRTRQHRITDILNLADQSFLILEDVTVEELGARGTPIKADVAQINLDSVLFAVAHVPIEASPELRTPKKPTEAIVSVPPFKITGTIHLMPGEWTLREALNELSMRFLPVTDAVYWSDHLGEGRQSAVIVAVNQKRTQILAQHQEVDPWAGLGAPAPATAPEPDPWGTGPGAPGASPEAGASGEGGPAATG
jgi:hypothetical protein